MTAVDVTDPQPGAAAHEDQEPDDFPFGLDEQGPAGPTGRWHLPDSINWPEAIITFVIVAFLVAFVFKFLQPSKLFLNTTTAGGDTGAHVWQPAFLRDHLLTHFRLTGWAPDWYAGFPSLVFYFPLPSLLIVILSTVVKYNVAFKLVTVLGLVSLPVAAWFFGRMARFKFPGPAVMAAATLPYLFARNYTIYGGNIASTLAGEFGFSISLALTLVFLGLVARGLETGKYRALAAVVLTMTGLSHLLPATFAIAGAVVLVLLRWDRRAWRWMAPVFAVAGGLAAFWWLPFLLRLPYATDMGYEKVTQYKYNLIPPHQLSGALYVLAIVGVFVSLLRRQKLGIFFTIMAGLSFLVFRFGWPAARLWNARALPFWFLCLYLLAAIAIAEGGALLLEPLRGGPVPTWSRLSTLALPVVVAVGVWILVGFPLHGLPGGSVDPKTGKYTWLAFSNSDTSFIPGWATWNYSGYESNTKSRRAEYFGLINTMTRLGQTDGCGRAMWEYEPGLDQMGTPDALMLLPYWTHSCIGSMEGLYYESSATTPYHFINAAELSLQPSDPVRGLTYPATPNVADGVRHLQLLGVKYYMALTPETQSQADTNPDLTLVATSGPWPESYASGSQSAVKERTWKIYQVANSQLVTPLVNQPVVMQGISKGGKQWLDAAQSWYLDQNRADVVYAASGPASWARVAPMSTSPPRTSLAPVQVDHIATSDNSLSFNVDTVGVPVLVKISYFPNWQASGANGPFRVAPNLMVVIPTSHHVTLHYGNTPVDWFGDLLGLLGLAALVWLVRAKPVEFANRRPALASTVDVAAAAGVDEAYLRMQRELAAGPGGPSDIDQWLGFPAGLGDIPSSAPGEPGTTPAPTRGLDGRAGLDEPVPGADNGAGATGANGSTGAAEGSRAAGSDRPAPTGTDVHEGAGSDGPVTGGLTGADVHGVAGTEEPVTGGLAGTDWLAADEPDPVAPGEATAKPAADAGDSQLNDEGELDEDTVWLGAPEARPHPGEVRGPSGADPASPGRHGPGES